MPTKAQTYAALRESETPMVEVLTDIKSLIYGDTGMGKTVLGMQLLQRFTPPNQRIVYIDTARGFVSFNNHPELKQRVTRMQYQGLSQIDTLKDAILEGVEGFTDIGGLMIDEVSSVQEVDLENVRIGRGESIGEFAAPTQPDMGVTTSRLRRTMSPLLSLPIHIVLTSHVREDEVKVGNFATGKRQVRPALMPKASQMLRGLVHEVTYLTADVDSQGKYSRSLQVMPTPKINCKTRIGGLPVAVSPARYLDAMQEWLEGSRPTNEATPDDGTVSRESDDSVGIVVE